jgi:hypothetical protein
MGMDASAGLTVATQAAVRPGWLTPTAWAMIGLGLVGVVAGIALVLAVTRRPRELDEAPADAAPYPARAPRPTALLYTSRLPAQAGPPAGPDPASGDPLRPDLTGDDPTVDPEFAAAGPPLYRPAGPGRVWASASVRTETLGSLLRAPTLVGRPEEIADRLATLAAETGAEQRSARTGTGPTPALLPAPTWRYDPPPAVITPPPPVAVTLTWPHQLSPDETPGVTPLRTRGDARTVDPEGPPSGRAVDHQPGDPEAPTTDPATADQEESPEPASSAGGGRGTGDPARRPPATRTHRRVRTAGQPTAPTN